MDWEKLQVRALCAPMIRDLVMDQFEIESVTNQVRVFFESAECQECCQEDIPYFLERIETQLIEDDDADPTLRTPEKVKQAMEMLRVAITNLHDELPPGKPLKLYWMITPDGDEDWFVVEGSEWAACRGHEDEEGYDLEDAVASYLMDIPEGVEAESGWPSHELLKACGAEFLREDTPRVVRLKGVQYTEGMLEHEIRQVDDDVFESRGMGRPNRTLPDGKGN